MGCGYVIIYCQRFQGSSWIWQVMKGSRWTLEREFWKYVVYCRSLVLNLVVGTQMKRQNTGPNISYSKPSFYMYFFNNICMLFMEELDLTDFLEKRWSLFGGAAYALRVITWVKNTEKHCSWRYLNNFSNILINFCVTYCNTFSLKRALLCINEAEIGSLKGHYVVLEK